MLLKITGAVLILFSCSFCGVSIAVSALTAEKQVQNLRKCILHMKIELQYQMTPLPDLVKNSVCSMHGEIQSVMLSFSENLKQLIFPNPSCAMEVSIQDTSNLTESAIRLLSHLGLSLGRFDLDGQIQGLEDLLLDCEQVLAEMRFGKTQRLRSYRTLGFCAGAAVIVILL